LQYAFYDWTREIPRSKRVLVWFGLFIQGYALWVAVTRSLTLPLTWPHDLVLMAAIWLVYAAGGLLLNGILTSELVLKTEMQSDLAAARRIQDTLHPHAQVVLPGYDIDHSYTPYRVVGGDYFDVVELQDGRTLFAMADVAGKGMPAALLAANVQALVRSIAADDPDPLTLATQINQHLNRYTPDDRFVTAIFIVLDQQSGALTYVNAGHNAPVLTGTRAVTTLDASGVPLGLFADAPYEAGTAVLEPGGALLLFTDGLPDSIRGDDPDARIRDAISATGAAPTIASLAKLVDRRLNADDITMVLVRRSGA
jgi:sigma-B regulation protein RsbU (phosphoserine phosphatase)